MADTISGHGQPGPPPSHDIPSQDPGSCCRHPRCRHRVPGRNRRRQEEEATGADSSRSDEGEPAGAASPRGDLQQPRGGVEDASSSKHVPLAQRLRDNRRLTELVGHKDRTFHLSFHPNGQLLASASEDCSVRLWDVTTGAVRQRIAQESEVLRVAWSGPLGGVDRVFLASASSTGKVRVWNVAHEKVVDGQKKEPVMRPECELSHGEESQVYACKFLDDSTLLTASDDMVHFWNLETKTKIGQWRFDQLSTGTAFGGSVRNPNNLCYVFDVECGALHAGASRSVLCVALSDGSVRVQDLRTSQAVAILRKTGGAHLTSLRLGPSASALVSCGGNGECTLWDTRNWSIRATLQGHTRPVYGAEFLPALLASTSGRAGAAASESLLMTWSTDETLRLWDVATAQGHVSPQDTILQPGFPILTCALSPLADRLAIGGGSGDAHAGHQHAANGACCGGANGSFGQLSSGTSILLRQL